MKKQRIAALKSYNKNYREMAQLRRRMAIVADRLRKYGHKLDECNEILESHGLKV